MSHMTAEEREAYREQQRLEKLAEKEAKKQDQKKMREAETLKKKEELKKVLLVKLCDVKLEQFNSAMRFFFQLKETL